MRAPQAVTTCPAASADAMRDTLVLATALADWPHGFEQLLAGLDRLAAGPGGPARGGRREAPDAGRRTKSAGEAPSVTGAPGQAELRTLFEAAAAGLTRGEREVVELGLRQGLTASEAAAVFGVSRVRARLLLTRAGRALEVCLAVLLVGRAGHGECAELGSLLAGWDGQLTATLRGRVHRHIERCPGCARRRAQELSPARLRDLSPGVAMAAGAAESFRRAPAAPAALRARTIALALGRAPGAAAHSSAVLTRAGTFGRRGFPRAGDAARAGLTRPRAARSLPAWLRPRSQRSAAAAVVAVLMLTAAASALTGGAAPLGPASRAHP
jgi:Sigma-70, region 4